MKERFLVYPTLKNFTERKKKRMVQMIYHHFHSKVGPSPGTPQDPQEPFQPLGHLGTLRTPFDPENLPATTSIPRDVMREKYFGNNKFFIFKTTIFQL